MTFKTYIEAFDFVLIKCALMTITLQLNLKHSTDDISFIPIERNNFKKITNVNPIKIKEIVLIIYDNFDAKYILILNNILKEQFNLNISRIHVFSDIRNDVSNFDDDIERLKEENIILRLTK